MKKIIFSFILGGLIFGSMGIYAASYIAGDISYVKGETMITVDKALDDLYKLQADSNISIAEILNSTNGSINVGTSGASAATSLSLGVGKYIILASYGGGSGRVTDQAAHPHGNLVKPSISSGDYTVIEDGEKYYLIECKSDTQISATASVPGWASSWFNAVDVNVIAIKLN